MNLIKELAERAWKKPMGNSWCYANIDEFQQRYAELIVKECADFFERNPQVMNVKAPPASPSVMIKHYFGVTDEQTSR